MRDAGEAVLEPLVLAEQVADLPGADADVAGGDVGVFADVAVEFDHQRLAEAHDLAVGLALRVEVGPALRPAHGQAGEAVLEGLLEAEELQDRGCTLRVEAEAALVGADRVVELDAPGAVDPDVAGVVLPGDAEDDDPVGFGHALEDLGVAVFGLSVDEGDERLGDLLDGLVELRSRRGCASARPLMNLSSSA